MLIKHDNFQDADGLISNVYADTDTGLYLFKYSGFYYISDQPGVSLHDEQCSYYTEFYSFNGHKYYQGSAGYIYYDNGKYIKSKNLGYCDLEDSWWECGSLTGTYAGKGTAETAYHVDYSEINGWKSQNLIGEYSPVGNKAGKKYVGNSTSCPIYLFEANVFYE